MKKLALVLIVMLFVIPAAAQFYSSGPINGNTDAWTINFGFIVSDRFYMLENNDDVTGATFAMWLFSGDTLTSAELSITSQENGGISYFDQTVHFTQGSCTSNQYGFSVCNENTWFDGPTLNAGAYWINLQNASVPSGDPVYWDENSGGTNAWPPGASSNSVGSIPAESFSLFAGCGAGDGKCQTSSATADQSSVPEPGSVLLLASGVVGIVGWLRRSWS
jgi:hypothetical protein